MPTRREGPERARLEEIDAAADTTMPTRSAEAQTSARLRREVKRNQRECIDLLQIYLINARRGPEASVRRRLGQQESAAAAGRSRGRPKESSNRFGGREAYRSGAGGER